MPGYSDPGFDTLALHAGAAPDPATGARAVPIHLTTSFVSPGDIAGWRAAVRPNTKLFFGETVGNPGLDVLDIAAVSGIAHDAGVPLLVDSTLTSPWLIKPLDHGADLVYHSASKFLSGHGTVIGGIVVDGGSFDWEKSGKFAELTEA